MNDIADKLDEARELIEAGWSQDAFARSESGRTVGIESPRARSFCASGAIRRLPMSDQAGRAFAKAIGVKGKGAIARWNDNPKRTQAEVIEAFRKAAELARGQVQS